IIKSTSPNCLSLPPQRSAVLRLCIVFLDLRPLWAHFVGFILIPSATIDASVCPIFVLWYNDVSFKREPLPPDDVVDLPLVEELNENHTLIRKYTDIRPTLIGCDKNGRCWFTYVSIPVSADPFKVKTIQLVDHTIMDESREADGKKKRKVGFSAGLPPLKKARAGGIAISKPNPTTAGKTPTALKTLGIQGQHDVGSGFAAHPTKDFVSSSVTVTPERECHDESGLTQDGNVRTRLASDHFVVLTSSSDPMDVDATIYPKVISSIPYVQTKAEVAVAGPVDETRASYIPWNEIEASSSAPDDGSPIDDSYDDVDFLDRLNVYSTQHVYMMSESCLQYEHEITIRERFEKKFVKSYETVQQKDAKIATLRSKLEKAEGEATDVIMLCRRVSELETATAAKAEELAVLSVQDIELLGKVSGLKSVSDELKCQVSKLEADYEGLRSEIADVAGRRWMIRHGLCLVVMKCSQSTEYHDALGRSIYMAINKGIQEGLEAGVEHGKAGRSLAKLEAYDSGVEGGYVSAVNELDNVSFSLLDQLEALKDSPLELVMSSLTLEGDHDYQILTVTIVDGTTPAIEPYDDLFDTNVPSTSDRHLIELKNQVQRLMEAHHAPTQPTQVNKITTSCEICSGPHDTQYCMEDPEQAFVEYASSRTDEAGGSCVNIIPLYLFKKLNIGPLEETDHVFGLADGTKSYLVWIVKVVEVHIGKLKLFNGFYVIDMKKDPETHLLIRRGFLATAKAVIDCRMAKIKESEDLIKNPINWDNPPKNGDRAWHAKIRLIDLDGDEFTKTLQSIPTTRKLFERESPRKIIDLDHFYNIVNSSPSTAIVLECSTSSKGHHLPMNEPLKSELDAWLTWNNNSRPLAAQWNNTTGRVMHGHRITISPTRPKKINYAPEPGTIPNPIHPNPTWTSPSPQYHPTITPFGSRGVLRPVPGQAHVVQPTAIGSSGPSSYTTGPPPST
nr:transposase (putative), gypsy type [Tanacetum cinerariifolium]